MKISFRRCLGLVLNHRFGPGRMKTRPRESSVSRFLQAACKLVGRVFSDYDAGMFARECIADVQKHDIDPIAGVFAPCALGIRIVELPLFM